ncbi:hypothetical protein GCG54_00003565 [Colletotrichum gloeosporioides]|uniref:Uncharacterized protein n=1 Tax=Colletotrichum gloeosporioides TaxID=474922 RepID=A0A8H4CB09_COLGL|nr:uncharacterized protein GCG54_00003565 [Colletotrichum gloeosporioides]KAF3800666.1 hypothetical protein GCG54_00003565 [Colletotrichum gloeosporioides]
MLRLWSVVLFFLLIGPSFGLPPLRGMVPRGRTRPHPNTAGSTNEKFHNCNSYKWDVYHGASAGSGKGVKENCCQVAGFTPQKGSKIKC